MKLRQQIVRTLGCGILLLASLMPSNAANGIIERKEYNVCPGDEITLTKRTVTVTQDTTLYDTIQVASPTMDSIYMYVVNLYPAFSLVESREIEPGTSFEWHGLTITKAGTYERVYKTVHQCDSTYRITVTEHTSKIEKEVTFSLCEDETVQFNGKTYSEAGFYYDDYTEDSIYKIHIIKHPSIVYLTKATFDGINPYHWLIGKAQRDSLVEAAGVLEYTERNTETGCNDLYRLILTEEPNSFHFTESETICEGEEFEWHGLKGLSRQGVGETTHYFDRYTTASGKDSIYELVLTVLPTHFTHTIPFCESIVWNGVTYTESTRIVDTLRSMTNHCDSIVITYLSKGLSFYQHDTATITMGETLEWHGQTINVAGPYEDKHVSSFGCDSIYTLGVGMVDAPPQAKIRKYFETICEGSEIEWRGKTYWQFGTYYDTTYVGGTMDSLYVLVLSVNPSYAATERVTFPVFPVTYRNTEITKPGIYPIHYTSSLGCDSIITVMVDREVIRNEKTVTICPGEVYSWRGHIYQEPYQYKEVDKDIYGNDSVEHILNLSVRYIPETRITKTICQGNYVTFGDTTLATSGVYRHIFKQDGCDSVVVLSLNVINPDTVRYVHNMSEGEEFVWHDSTYTETGVDFYSTSNSMGCDSIEMLILTVNHVDTIDTVAVICPNETMTWHGITARQTGKFTGMETQPDGTIHYYRLDLTVRELAEKKESFTICADESITYNGKTYDKPGYFYDKLGCDTLVEIHISQLPQQVYETQAKLGEGHGYTWTYWSNGKEHTETFSNTGTYEYESPNKTTGCSDIWRLILTKDETEYHFVENHTICEGDEYSWHGLNNLSGQPGTSHYFDKYQTRTGKDSIYELVLTVIPIRLTARSISFCGEITWKGTKYVNSAVVYDTIAISSGCYRIERINLDRAQTYYFAESKQVPQGQILHWHGQNISTDGTYYDRYTTAQGCDSIYAITVEIIPAAPETNQYTEELSSCEGDTILWRGKSIWRSGTYVDTVWAEGKEKVDSIFTLSYTAWPAPKDTIYQHLFSCNTEPIRYNGKYYRKQDTVVTVFHTIHGCDSIVKAYMHFNEALRLEQIDTIADTELPFTWTFKIADPLRRDTVLTAAGTYHHKVIAEGGCTNEEYLQLVVFPTYLYELDTTICETDLPFIWRGKELQHTIGETKQYEERFLSVNNTDSIYRLHLTIDPAPKRIERHSICENKDTLINGKSYFDPTRYLPGVVYRDTAYKHNTGDACDSIIYYEIIKVPQRHNIETRILHYEEESFEWHGMTIERAAGSRTYTIEDEIDPETGCEIIYQMRVVVEQRDIISICSLDTATFAWSWNGQKYTQTGLFTDTVRDEAHYITEFHTLDLTVSTPVDTTIYLKGCIDKGGVTFLDKVYKSDTIVRDTLRCDTMYTAHITVGRADTVYITDTICETSLPYILGRQNPDTIWSDNDHRPQKHSDTTACGCDSTVILTLYIIPTLSKNDSTFRCEDEIADNPVYLGDTIDPWFEHREGGRFSGKWQGKWHGVKYTEDTIVWDCNHTYFHHIFVRPRQKTIPQKTYSICKGDSVQLFWPHDTTWISKPGVYYDTVPNTNAFTDPRHNTMVHNDRAYVCDSITEWTVVYADTAHFHLYKHIREGENYLFNDSLLSTTGVYDSIGDYTTMDSAHNYCKAVYSLHLSVEPVLHYQDTIEICHIAKREYTYTFDDDRAEHFAFKFQTPDKDTAILHFTDSLQHLSYELYDHFYDLVVYYKQLYHTTIFDTICEGTSLRFDSHHHDNTVTQRYLDTKGVYTDTLIATNNGCDSIITLYLETRDSIPTTYLSASIVDRDLPFEWKLAWQGGSRIDSLYETGVYRDTVPSIHGCDSILAMNLTVRPTYLYRDTISVCEKENKTLTHYWAETNYTQKFTTPIDKDTAHITYADTIVKNYPADSIFYELYVLYHKVYETHIFRTICFGDSAQINTVNHADRPKLFFKETGIYHDTVPTFYGCDSIITLHLDVRPGFPPTIREKHIADVDTPYLWIHTWMEDGVLKRDTDSLYTAGGHSVTLPNIHGCDSIDSLVLYIHQTYRITDDTLNICDRDIPYTWRGLHNITTTGDYSYGVKSSEGYDSIHYVHINVWKQTYDTLTAFICEGDSIRWGMEKETLVPRYAKTSGLYNDTLSTIHGCDSIRVLRLTVYPSYHKGYTVDIADVDTPYVWKHFNVAGDSIGVDSLYATGKYGFNFKTGYGCDSIDTLHLRIHNTYRFTEEITICERETPYTWQNQNGITKSGTYYYDARTQDGYDSIFIATITVIPTQYAVIHEEICADKLPFYFYGKALNEGGIYKDTIASDLGCDSIVELHLTVNHPYYHFQRVDIYEDQLPYTFFDQVCDKGGTFTHEAKTPAGCDSISQLMLVTHPVIDTIATICSYDLPFEWVNHWTGETTLLHRAGLYHNDTTYVNGERTFWSIQLNVVEPTYDTLRVSICEGTGYHFGGNIYKKSGVYTDTTKNASGCDSVTTLVLTVNQPYYLSIREDILEGQEVNFFGDILKTTDTYYHYGKTPEGCDSTTVLELVVHPLVDTVITVCSHDLPYRWTNRWSGKEERYYAAGTYRNDTTINGEKRFFGFQLLLTQPSDTTIYREICEGSYYNFGGLQRTETNEYRDTLINQYGCDSVIVLHLNVLKTYHNIVSHSIYEGDSVEFLGSFYKQAGVYPFRYTSSYGCDSVVELNLTVKRLYDDSVSVCANELPYIWRNREIHKSGVYRDTVYADGKEVVTGLKVTVLPILRAPEPVVAMICEGDYYKFGDSLLNEQGTYYDTLTAVNGCDSIVMLSLQVIPVKYQTEYRRIFEGDSVLFDGKWYKESGVYERRETNANNCTDTYQLVLTVLSTFNIDTTAVICKNELPFIWRGYEYNESGDYSLPIAWTDSSRVVKTLHLTVNETYYGERNVALCQGSMFIYKGKEYSESMSFYDTIPSLTGCDSIIKYIVSVHPTYDRIDTMHISDKQTYTFYGRVLNQTGFYEHTQTTQYGCDSVHHLYLVVHPSYFFTDTVDLCRPDSLLWHEQIIKQSGTYTDSLLTTKFGFDSVYQVVVNVHQSYYLYEKYEIAEDQHLKIHGMDISIPGIYEDTLKTIYGCDSIFHIVVNLKRTVELEITDSICQGDYYEFFGKKLYNPGKYVNVDKANATITTLFLKVNPISIRDTVITIPNTQDSYIYNGKLYTGLTEGKHLFTETYRNQYNCDSTVRIIINVTRRYSEWMPIPLCPGSEIKIDNKVITEAGLYMFVRRSRVTGEMDSLYRVEVYDAPAYEFYEEHTICDGDTLYYGDKPYMRAGHYDISLKTTEGCDSIFHVDIKVNPSYHYYQLVTTQDYAPYEWFGRSYFESGVYDRSWPTIHDCDSTYTLDLRVIETLRDTLTETICTGQAFNWRGKQYSVDGYYTDTVWQPEAPFSAIYALRLYVAYPTIITDAHVGEVCADNESFDISFDYTGEKPTHYSVFFGQLAKREGFEDIIDAPFGSDMIAHIYLPQFDKIAYEDHPYYVRPDYYTMRIALDNGVCGVSRSDSLTLLVKYPSWIIEQNWDDVVAPLKAEYNGGYEFAQTEWRVNDAIVVNKAIGYLHYKELHPGDQVVMWATRQGETVAIPTCPLTIQAMGQLTYDTPVIVYPTQAPREMPAVTIEAPQQGRYDIYTATGLLLHSGSFDEGKTSVTLPPVSGIYFIRTMQGKHIESHKVILY